MLGKIVIGLVVAAVLFLGYGAIIGNSPEGKQKSVARDAIDLCWKGVDDSLQSLSTRRFVRGTCQKMVAQYEEEYGPSSTIRKE
ncbi:hypothetical protein [Pseudomonas fluorescens]|uniref:hypothetical protein n=1 Tax=Pseudomonas fluorescens TaxID=294 RepID=UPI0016562054|nr:hypothetical protein [Pseudomonas fluorescens]MBC8783634.1 hypothetical protein [Pseudomonas fluorescens]